MKYEKWKLISTSFSAYFAVEPPVLLNSVNNQKVTRMPENYSLETFHLLPYLCISIN